MLDKISFRRSKAAQLIFLFILVISFTPPSQAAILQKAPQKESTITENIAAKISETTSKKELKKFRKLFKSYGVDLNFRKVKYSETEKLTRIEATAINRKNGWEAFKKAQDPTGIKSFLIYLDKERRPVIKEKDKAIKIICHSTLPQMNKPLIILNGIPQKNSFEPKDIDPITIERINIIKSDQATVLYGTSGQYGAIIIATNPEIGSDKGQTSDKAEHRNKLSSTNNEDLMYVINGRQVEKSQITDLVPGNIDHINVLKGKKGTDKYGQKGANGVVEIYLKQ